MFVKSASTQGNDNASPISIKQLHDTNKTVVTPFGPALPASYHNSDVTFSGGLPITARSPEMMIGRSIKIGFSTRAFRISSLVLSAERFSDW